MDYFTQEEKTCRCGCGLNLVDKVENTDFKLALNSARELYGKPIIATCMTRCEKHNREVGGVDGSAHKDGRAIDIACNDYHEREKLVESLMKAGFRRFELSPVHVHADMKRGASPVILIKTDHGIV